MLSERKKKTMVLTLAFISLVLNMMFALPFGSLAHIWYRIRLFYWGWIPAFILPLVAIIGTIYWKPGRGMLRGFILLLSIIAIIIASIWYFLLVVVANFNP
jgi:hypothetical protein